MIFESHTAYLGLGSNIGARKQNLDAAIAAIAALPGTVVEAVSSFINTAPVGLVDQPDFLNAVIRVRTGLSPHALLGAALGIEAAMGRVRNVQNGPRVIDIDLLMMDDFVINTSELVVPHPRMEEREFVMVPLGEVKKC